MKRKPAAVGLFLLAVSALSAEGRPVNHHGLPRFSEAPFDAAYPFGQVNLSDKKLPIHVRVKGFNPLIPGEEDDSGIPIAVLTCEVTNTGDEPVQVSVCGSMRNFLGKDGSRIRRDWKGDFIPVGAKDNVNEYWQSAGLQGIFLYTRGVDPKDAAWGTVALVTDSPTGVSYCTSSTRNSWANALLDFWDDFSEDGMMCFRAMLPLSNAQAWKRSAADGQMGTVMKFYRDWHLSGKLEFLRNNWSAVKKVLDHAWIKGGWDGNRDGVMEGSQHNTMDMNYFGPNPQMQFWYMGALKAAAEMAAAMNDPAFGMLCNGLHKRGSAWMDRNLFNGEYYEQKITDRLHCPHLPWKAEGQKRSNPSPSAKRKAKRSEVSRAWGDLNVQNEFDKGGTHHDFPATPQNPLGLRSSGRRCVDAPVPTADGTDQDRHGPRDRRGRSVSVR